MVGILYFISLPSESFEYFKKEVNSGHLIDQIEAAKIKMAKPIVAVNDETMEGLAKEPDIIAQIERAGARIVHLLPSESEQSTNFLELLII